MNTTAEPKKKAVESKAPRPVKLLAIKPTFERAPAEVVPYFDEVERLFKVGKESYKATVRSHPKNGDEFYCDETPVPITDKTSFRIKHGNVYDLNNPKDKFYLQIMLDSGMVAKNFQSINTGSQHRFYLKDDQADAKASISKVQQVRKALELIGLLTAEDMASFAFYMGQPARTMTGDMIQAFVEDLAITKPDTVVEELNNRIWKHRAFVSECIAYSLITADGGVHKLAGSNEVIGKDRDATVQFLLDSKNNVVATQLVQALAKASGKDKQIPETDPIQ